MQGHGLSYADNKRRARLNCIYLLLSLIPCKKVHKKAVKLPKVSHNRAYDDQATMKDRRFVPEKF